MCDSCFLEDLLPNANVEGISCHILLVCGPRLRCVNLKRSYSAERDGPFFLLYAHRTQPCFAIDSLPAGKATGYKKIAEGRAYLRGISRASRKASSRNLHKNQWKGNLQDGQNWKATEGMGLLLPNLDKKPVVLLMK